MKLLPTLRQKKRYVVFEVLSDLDKKDTVSKGQFAPADIHSSVQQALRSFLGELGMAKASPMLLPERTNGNRFVLKVNHTWVDECKAALTVIKKIKNQPVLLRSITVSGTLKKVGASLK